ncbi:uncharacterized protein LOC122850407 [Aphidius gifuensis]|uniref:uncharacterized protein LOC122850407 n=1 Tax=Aphidius gifuensis TaxID=684658 RepID=UPI001CDD5AE3|nr:uncharacterized protein LOC122850407 [Aphidius gifuensis]
MNVAVSKKVALIMIKNETNNLLRIMQKDSQKYNTKVISKLTIKVDTLQKSVEKSRHTLDELSTEVATGHSAGSDLLSGGYDIWLGATTIHLYPQGHYSYTHQIARTSYSLFAMSEGTHVSNYWYTMIFSQSLWYTTLFFLLTVAAFLVITYRLKKNFCKSYSEYHDEFSGVSFILIFVLGGVTGQGIQTIPSSWSLRVLIVTALLMGAVISCGFSSTLTSFLAIRGRRLPLKGLEDVAMKRTHSLCVRNDSGAYVNLTTTLTAGAPLRAEWKDIVNTKHCPDMKDTKTLGTKLCNPGVVFLEAPDVFLSVYRLVQHRCDVVQINGDYWPLKISFLFARSSRIQLIINKYLVRLHSSGILKYLEKKWISREFPDSTDHKFSFKPVEHAHIRFIFLGLCLFIIISAVVCVFENVWYNLSTQIAKSLKVRKRKKLIKVLRIAFTIRCTEKKKRQILLRKQDKNCRAAQQSRGEVETL